MDYLSYLLVGQPLHILFVSFDFLVLFFVSRYASRRSYQNSKPLLIIAILWLLYAAWEFLVQVNSPEANIRVDLLVIWPILGFLTIWYLIKFVITLR